LKELGCASGVVGKISRRRFNGIYFIRFGLKMKEILNFKRLLSLKIQINHKKPIISKKKS
jgi:hypothetical protein